MPFQFRMVEGIVCLRAELEGHPFVNRELLEQAHVPVVESRVVNSVPGWRAGEGVGCRRGELRRFSVRTERNRYPIVGLAGIVYHLAGIADITAGKIEILAAIGEVAILPDAGEILVPQDLDRCAGLSLEDAADLPAAQDFPAKLVCPRNIGQLVEEVDDHNVAYVEIGCGPVGVGIVGIGEDVRWLEPSS